MDCETKSEHGPRLPIGLSNNNLKLDLLSDDFKCIDNFLSSYLQTFDHLDHFPLETSLSNLQPSAFDPFCHDSSSDFVLYDVMPCEENGRKSSILQNFQGGELLNFPNWKDPLVNDPKPLSFVNIPVEISCVTADDIACNKKDKESEYTSAKKSGKLRKKSKSAKGQWTVEEDRVLICLVEKYGVRKWSSIAKVLKGRIGKQCRERWHNHLRPDIKKDLWSEEEDRVLIEAHAEVGNKWAEIAIMLPGRTENSIKNHWNATKMRQFSRRKCRTKWPRPSSLLQNYIKSLNFEKGNSSRTRITNDPGIFSNTIKITEQLPEVEYSSVNCAVQEYGFNELLPDFVFSDDRIFEGSSVDSFMDDVPGGPPIEIDSFMDDVPDGPPIEIDDEQCFDVELSFGMPPLMHAVSSEEGDCYIVRTSSSWT